MSKRMVRKTVISGLCMGAIGCLVLIVWVVFALRTMNAGDRDLLAERYHIIAASGEEAFLINTTWRTAWRPLADPKEADERYRFLAERSGRGRPHFHNKRVKTKALVAGPFDIKTARWRMFNIRQQRDGKVWSFTRPTVEAEVAFLQFNAPRNACVATLLGICGILLAYPVITFVRGPVRRFRRYARGQCGNCNYDLRGSIPVDRSEMRAALRDATRRSWRYCKRRTLKSAVFGAGYAIGAPLLLAAVHWYSPDSLFSSEYSLLTGHPLPAERFYPDGRLQLLLLNIIVFGLCCACIAFFWTFLRSPFAVSATDTRTNDTGNSSRCPECGCSIPITDSTK